MTMWISVHLKLRSEFAVLTRIFCPTAFFLLTMISIHCRRFFYPKDIWTFIPLETMFIITSAVYVSSAVIHKQKVKFTEKKIPSIWNNVHRTVNSFICFLLRFFVESPFNANVNWRQRNSIAINSRAAKQHKQTKSIAQLSKRTHFK